MAMPVLPFVNLDFRCNNNKNDITKIFENNDDVLLGTLESPYPNHFECNVEVNGITPKNNHFPTIIESKNPIANFRNHFLDLTTNINSTTDTTIISDKSGLTVELWIALKTVEFKNQLVETRPILTIGRHYNEQDVSQKNLESNDYVGCNGYDLLLAQRGRKLKISYADNDFAQTCRSLMVRLPKSLTSNEKLQTTLVLNEGETKVFFNGDATIAGARNSFRSNLSIWNPDYHFQFFSNRLSTENSNFQGTIQQASVYDFPMDVNQIRSRYELGLQGPLQEKYETASFYLQASPFDIIVLEQGRTTAVPILIGGVNASTPNWDILVEITSLPQHGRLISANSVITMDGFRIQLVGNLTFTTVSYQTWPKDYFNIPSTTFSGVDLDLPPESFTYRLLAIQANTKSGEEIILGVSEPITKEIYVRHVNKKPLLSSPRTITVPAVQPTGAGAQPKAILEDVIVLDEDQNIDRIRLDVWVQNGTLTMNEDFRSFADFKSCADRTLSSWQCHGSGIGDRNMTFVAEPDDISLILSNLQYSGFFWDQSDSIVIRVFDGSGGQCLHEWEHMTRYSFEPHVPDSGIHLSIHDDCFQVTATIEIPAIPGSGNNDFTHNQEGVLASLFDTNDFGTPDIIFWVFVCAVACALFCMLRQAVNCVGRRGRKVYPDNANYLHNAFRDEDEHA